MTDTLIIAILAISIINTFLLLFAVFSSKNSNNTDNFKNYYENLKNLISYAAQGSADITNKNSELQRERLKNLEDRTEYIGRMTEARINDLKDKLQSSLKNLNEENIRQLDLMRRTVDEKLSETLEKRLNQSFELVSERLEAVYKGIGEMHQIAGNVSDLKKVFSNVKLRGTWGELQLESLLSEMLAPSQYIKSCKIAKKDGNEMVDFAVIIPAKDSDVLLPIDSKFPIEEFTRYLNALEEFDRDSIYKAQKNFENVLKKQADSIASKYIIPPLTTDFAVMYLPIESLYAEAMKIEGLADLIQRKRIIMCGPSNLAALLTALQTGLRTIAIEKRSEELWQLLSAFKHEFSRFAELLCMTQKKLQEAQDTIDDAAKKTRRIERKLKDVSEISSEKSNKLLDAE